MQASRRLPQERVQHVLPRLHERGALLALPRLPPRPQINTDKEVVVPRRDQGERDTEGAGHRRRADVHHQQRPRRLPQRAPAAEARQGRHQHLRGLRPQPPRLLPLLLPRLQDCRHRRGLQQDQPSAEQEEEQEGDRGSGRVGLRAVLHEHQPRQQRQEQCDPELHPLDPAADRRQLPRRQAAEGHPSQSSLRKPHARILIEQAVRYRNQPTPPSSFFLLLFFVHSNVLKSAIDPQQPVLLAVWRPLLWSSTHPTAMDDRSRAEQAAAQGSQLGLHD